MGRQMNRMMAIRAERKKQFLLGQRERPWEIGFPKLYDVIGDFYQYNPRIQ